MKVRRLILPALVVALVGWRLVDLQSFEITPPEPGESESDAGRLFLDGLELGLLEQEAGGMLRVAPSDHWLGLSPGSPAMADAERLLGRLYTTPAGREVLLQIGHWNRTRKVAAVRDDFTPDGGANRWVAVDPALPGRTFETSNDVPLEFGFLLRDGLVPGFGPWLSALRVGRLQTGLRFERDLANPEGRPGTIQVVGVVRKVTFDGREVETAPLGNAGPRCSAERPVAVRASGLCPGSAHCAVGEPATVKKMRIAACKAGRLGIEVEPVVNASAMDTPGISIFAQEVPSGEEQSRRETGLVSAQVESPLFYGWREGAPTPLRVREPVPVLAMSGEELLDSTGTPSGLARELGLVGLVGFGPGDPKGLAGLIRRGTRQTARPAELTLDLSWQRAARAAVEQAQRRIPVKWRERYARERRVALVVMDADSGAILAVAGQPNPEPGIGSWDFLAYEQLYTSASPLWVRAWEGSNRHYTPGSTSKLLTGLALIEGSREYPEIARLVRGVGHRDFRELTGLDWQASSWEPAWATQPVGNAAGTRFDPGKPLLLGTHHCPVADGDTRSGWERYIPASTRRAMALKSGRLGIPQAIRDSSNVWFTRLGDKLDGELRCVDGKPGHAVPYLAKVVRQLGLDQPLDLAGDLPDKALGRISHDRLRADRVQLAKRVETAGKPANCDPAYRWDLLQNAFGQVMQSTPLRMTQVVAAIATGKIVKPYLFHAWDGEVLPTPDSEPLGVTGEGLGLLRLGMKAVVERGTASGVFENEEACRIFGKTGTANIGKRRPTHADEREAFNSAWFIGWREPGGDEPRVAFACLVTHVPRAGAGGGTVCAPVVNDMIKAWKEGQR